MAQRSIGPKELENQGTLWGAGKQYDDFITLISSVPLEERCIHDVHIYFRANGIYDFIKLVGNVMKIAAYSKDIILEDIDICLLYTSPSPRD